MNITDTELRPVPTVLKAGKHETAADGMCLTEAVAYVAASRTRPGRCAAALCWRISDGLGTTGFVPTTSVLPCCSTCPGS